MHHITAPLRAVAVLAFASAVLTSGAAPVESRDASRAVQAWVARDPAPLDDRFPGASANDVRTFEDEDGTAMFHVVFLDGGGFVVTSADDEIHPIVLFSADVEEPDLEPGSPLFDFLAGEMSARMDAIARRAARSNAVAGAGNAGENAAEPPPSAAKREWASLLAPSAARASVANNGRESVSDVRVPKLLGSKWNQGEVRGVTAYNHYTPYNYVCGCGATALAQIMRYHRFPKGNVTPQSKWCYVDGCDVKKTMKGGTYQWDDMPLIPGAVTPTLSLAQRQAIGKLAYDCGVALMMNWTEYYSSSYPDDVAPALTEVFGYSSAVYEYEPYGFSGTQFRRILCTNLDAGYPCFLAIYGDDGHAVVADGYGFQGSSLYCHVNMGWSGSCDLWYRLPDIDDYTSVESIVYNIYPAGSGDILSGRVLSASGAAVPGASVKLRRDGSIVASTTSNAKGIYAFRAPSGFDYSVEASVNDASGSASASLSPSSRNSWGNDVFLSGYEPPETFVSLSDALDNTVLPFTTGGYSKWIGRTRYNSDGVDSAQSGPCADGKVSWLKTTVRGPGTLSFQWKVSSEANCDWLECWVDGAMKARISGEVKWSAKSIAVTGAGAHTVQWRYAKDSSGASGDDCGRVDSVRWTPNIPLAAAVDNESLSFATGGYAKWTGSSAVTWDGVDAARSGPCADNKASWMSTTVRGAGTLSFRWKTSSEYGYDWLELWIDGKKKARISGRIGWVSKSVDISGKGSHTVTWRYAKDSSEADGSDAGWVDTVRWTGH